MQTDKCPFQGAFKYFEKKIFIEEGLGWSLAMAFAGDVGLAREIRERIVAAMHSLDDAPDRELL